MIAVADRAGQRPAQFNRRGRHRLTGGDIAAQAIIRLIVKPLRLIDRAVDMQRGFPHITGGADERPVPSGAEMHALGVGAYGPQDVEGIEIHRHPAAQRRHRGHQAIGVARQHRWDFRGCRAARQPLIRAGIQPCVGALAEAFEVDRTGEDVAPVMHLEVTQIGRGAGAVDIKPPAPDIVDTKLAFGEQMPAEVRTIIGKRGINAQEAAVEAAAIGQIHRRPVIAADQRLHL